MNSLAGCRLGCERRQAALGGLLLAAGLAACLGCQPKQSAQPKPPEGVQRSVSQAVEVAESSWDASLAALRSGSSAVFESEHQVDAGVCRELAALPRGQLLDLMLDGGVADEALPGLMGLQGLEHLRIRKTQITDQQLAQLVSGSLDSLRILNLPQSVVTAAGLSELKRLTRLQQLRLGGRQVDDAAAQRIAAYPELRSLHLIGPDLTGAGLLALAESPKLSSLYIDDCPLPDAAWQKLFEAKPGIHVHIDQQHHDRDPSRHEH